MTDFHRNIFYYYRGAEQPDQTLDRQLENNTTKALINTLEYCDCKVVIAFLRSLGIRTTKPIKFELQKKTIGKGKIKTRAQRLLLGILPSAANKEDTNKQDTNICSGVETQVRVDSCPDAWIYGDDFVVLIESKVTGPLEKNQMRLHFQKLEMGGRKPRYTELSWAEVHQLFHRLLPGLRDKDKLIVEQFTKYLEANSMAGFVGFEQEVFDYFVTHDDEDSRRWVRDAVASFADEVKGRMQAFDSFYEDCDKGVLRLQDEECWVGFGPANREYRNLAHQTITLGAYSLEVFVNVELKPAIERLRRKIRTDRAAFRKIVAGLEPFTLQLEERIPSQPRRFDYKRIASIDSYCLKRPNSELGRQGFSYVEETLEKIPLPYLSVRRRFLRDRVLKLCQKDQGRSLVAEVVNTMQEFHKLVDFINMPE